MATKWSEWMLVIEMWIIYIVLAIVIGHQMWRLYRDLRFDRHWLESSLRAIFVIGATVGLLYGVGVLLDM